MKRALLLYNPESGPRRRRRVTHVEAAAAVFRSAAVEAEVERTRAAGSAAAQVREALERGCDAVIVCGGDGSINEVLPSLVGTRIALGVIPLGTGNGLAQDLGLPRDPAKAAQALVSARLKPVAIPQIEFTRPNGSRQTRYWLIAAGIGADAEMVYRLALRFKRSWGMAAYYAESTRQWLTHDFPLFTAEFRDSSGQTRREQVSQVLAVRISWFGGLLRQFVPGAALDRPDYQLVLFKTRRRIVFLRYMMGVWSGRPFKSAEVEIVPTTECRCFGPRDRRRARRIYAEADGELLGTLPVAVTMSRETVNLLVP